MGTDEGFLYEYRGPAFGTATPRGRAPRQGALREWGRRGRRRGWGCGPRRWWRWRRCGRSADRVRRDPHRRRWQEDQRHQGSPRDHAARSHRGEGAGRSEEHTAELQSLMRISYAVFCLKKKIETIPRPPPARLTQKKHS